MKSRAPAVARVFLPSAWVRLHARLNPKLGNCPATAPAGTDHPELEKDWDCLEKQTFWPAIQPGLDFELKMPKVKDKAKEYPTVKDLQNVLDSCKLHLGQIDEVWPNIFIGNL